MAEHQRITIASGFEIETRITGDPKNPVIMLLNGSIFNYKQFDSVYLPYLKKYLDTEFCIIQHDYVGYGYSSPLPNGFDFVTIADQTVELMDALEIDQAHLFGLSKGSVIGQIIAAKYPDRVLSFGAYGSPNLANSEGNEMAQLDYQKRLQHTRQLQDQYDDRITDDNFELVYNTVYVKSLFGKSVDDLGILERLQNKWIKRKLRSIMVGPKIEILDKLFSYYLREISSDEIDRYKNAVQSITAPCLFIHGDNDTTVPLSSSELLHDWVPNSQLVVLEGLSHSRPTLISWQGKKIMREYSEFLKDLE